MFILKGDNICAILHIIYLSASSGAHHGKKAQHITRPPHTVSSASTTTATTSTATSEISNEGISEFDGDESREQMQNRLKKLENDLVDITQGFSSVSDVTQDVSVLFKSLEYQANVLQSVCKDIILAPAGNTAFPADQFNPSVRGMADIVLKLKSQIPTTGSLRVESVSDLINHLVKMPTYQEYQGCLALQNFEKNYRSLDHRSKHCLFCFSAFPEGYVVDKTFLMYWWVGEGLIDPEATGDRIAEEFANVIVKQFLELQFIEPAATNGKLVGLRMHPVLRYAVAYLAERAKFFDFDFEWNPTADFRLCRRACLVETADSSSQKQLAEGASLHPEKLKTLLNINMETVEITGKWFKKIKNVNVLFLGVWKNRLDFGCQLIGEKYLKWLKRTKHLKFLGLEGIGQSFEFQGAVGKLENLRILTLKGLIFAKLPNSIRSLRRLTHLDINYQYGWIDVPKVIGELPELQVLKGFRIKEHYQPAIDHATLEDLAVLKKLRKLSIVMQVDESPIAFHFDALHHITSLRKLTIVCTYSAGLEEARRTAITLKLPPDLQKLDLQDFPKTRDLELLMAGSLKSLQKLYIRGGHLPHLGENDMRQVKILRLIDLPEFHMDWRRVEDEFPDLIYLETKGCRKLTSFPCDANGVWLNKEMLTEKLLEELGFGWSFLATYQRHN